MHLFEECCGYMAGLLEWHCAVEAGVSSYTVDSPVEKPALRVVLEYRRGVSGLDVGVEEVI
jgi:hypothetical protein